MPKIEFLTPAALDDGDVVAVGDKRDVSAGAAESLVADGTAKLAAKAEERATTSASGRKPKPKDD